MFKINCSLFIVLLMFAYPNIIPQTVPKSANTKTSTQCRWVGTVKSANFLYGEQTIVANVIFEFDRNTSIGPLYKLTGGNATWSATGMAGDCKVSGGPLQFDISADSGDIGDLSINSDGTYIGGGGFSKLGPTHELVTFNCPEDIFSTATTCSEFMIGKANLGWDWDTIQVGGVMSGSVEEKAGDFVFRSFHWDLHLEGADTKLFVESDEYDDWLPTAGKNENDIGTKISFRAKLLEADGTTACAIADSIKFELINVSNEPGIALNFPDENKAEEDWDLHFIQEFNLPDDVMSSDRLSLVTKGGSEAIVLIPSFDWGAYGKLKVTAFMHGGKIITGFLKSNPGMTEIPIPKRSGTSKIADKWKKDKEVVSLADDDDAENEPVGDGLVDGHVGDGFTLYEEYRGFYENGKHIFGDPKRKDLFIYTSIQAYIPGIQLFKGLTKLNVHYRLTENEFDTKKRMMNFNHTDAPHQTDQHGLWVKQVANLGYSFTPFLGPPKRVDSVNISNTANINTIFVFDNNRIEERHNLVRAVAHELGHAVRIDHHGPDQGPGSDQTNSYKSSVDNNNGTISSHWRIIENGLDTIDARLENDNPYTDKFTDTAYIGVWGAQHSGFEDCIMKYAVAFAYIPGPNTTGKIRYVTGINERTGMKLCETKDGTGVNDNNRKPRPRYGPAAIGLYGNCKSRFCVNDKYH